MAADAEPGAKLVADEVARPRQRNAAGATVARAELRVGVARPQQHSVAEATAARAVGLRVEVARSPLVNAAEVLVARVGVAVEASVARIQLASKLASEAGETVAEAGDALEWIPSEVEVV